MATLLTTAVLMLATVQHHDSRLEVVRPYDAKLERIAQCESHKHWGTNTGNGFFGGL